MPQASRRPERLSLTPLLGSRDETRLKDARLVDGFVEKGPDGVVRLQKRYGQTFIFGDPTYADAEGFGCFYWNDVGLLYYIVAKTGVGHLRKAFDDGSGQVTVGSVGYFTKFPYWFAATKGTPAYMYLSDGNYGYTVNDSAVFAQIVDPGYPRETVPGAAYLDGTLYIMSTLGVIHGSDLNNPTTWSASNTISPVTESAAPVAISKQNIYVVALMSTAIEFFYDAQNPAGSPLLPLQNARLSIGCLNGYSVAKLGDRLAFIGTESAQVGNPAVFVVEALQAKKISTPPVERILAGLGDDLYNPIRAWPVHFAGHYFYVINVGLTLGGSTKYSLAFDFDTGEWSYWSANGASSTADKVDSASWYVQGYDDPTGAVGGFLGGYFYKFDAATYIDNPYYNHPQPVTFDYVAANWDAGTRLQKVFTKLRVDADRQGGGSLMIRWSDDDYATWSPWVTVDLSQDAPQLTNLGTSRRRAFQFRHASPSPFRMAAPEVEVLLGSM